MKNKGVTLIALIITIIILLVLAGVSLSALVGENGILTRAASVEEEYSKGELEEQLTMLINEKLVDAYEEISQSDSDDDIDIGELFNEKNLITYLTDSEYIEVGKISSTEDSSTVSDVLEQIQVNLIYYINASNIASNIDNIGNGANDGTFINVFTLEVITTEKTDDDGNTTTVSSGKYNINYYDGDGVCKNLTEVLLYTTNNS